MSYYHMTALSYVRSFTECSNKNFKCYYPEVKKKKKKPHTGKHKSTLMAKWFYNVNNYSN